MYIGEGGASKRQQLEMSKGKESVDEKRSNIDERVACLVGSAMKASQLLSPRHCNTLQRTAPHCNALQQRRESITAISSTLQHSTAYCNTLQKRHECIILFISSTAQHSATHCSTLQHTATHCNNAVNTMQLLSPLHCNT